MEQTTLLEQATNLTMFGMGFVFLFLSLLIFATKLMSIITHKFAKEEQINNNSNQVATTLDAKTEFIIKQAIKMHVGT